MNSSLLKERGVPLVFFATTVIAYGLFLSRTGFYWDDWPFVWIAKFLGPADFFPAFANIRPFLSPIFFITTSLLPPEPIYWQIFMIVIRFASGLLAWWVFRQVWPAHAQAVLAASFLFLLFPGYSQHWVAFTHINQEWIALLFYLLSFGLTARALRNPDRFRIDTFLALLFLVPGVFPTEYFLGLEPLRFLFIWVIVSERTEQLRAKALNSFKIWIPYLLIWLANAAWLAYFYTIGSYTSYDVEVATEPISVSQAVRAVGEAIWKAGFYAWVQVLELVAEMVTAPSSLLTLLLAGVSFIFLVWYLSRFHNSTSNSRSFAIAALVIGIVGILLGRLPSFAAGLPLTLQSSYDRFMISMMVGGSLFVAGLVEFLIRNRRVKTFIYAALIALAVGQQFFNANIFRRDWADQQEFFWQLAWRIPDLEPGTLLLADQLPVDYETDLSFTAPINWMYDPEYTRSRVPYALVYTEKRLGGSLPSLERGVPVKVYLRTVHFDGSTSQAIVIYMPRNGCLRVLAPQWGDEVTYERLPDHLVRAIPLSNPGLIHVDAETTPGLPFFTEPEHDWCYYYTKAELARQQQDWEGVNRLLAEATSLGYQPADPFEWLPFIEARAMTGNLQSAENLSRAAFASDRRIRDGLCQVWLRIEKNLNSTVDSASLDQTFAEYRCAP